MERCLGTGTLDPQKEMGEYEVRKAFGGGHGWL